MTEEILNHKMINSLIDMNDDEDDDFFGEIVDEYYKQVQKNIDLMNICLNERDFDGLKNIAHGLKGTSLNIGATKVASLAKMIEIKANVSDFSSLVEILKSLEEYYLITKDEIQKLRT